MRVSKRVRYSVLLLYPDYIADQFGESCYYHVKARSGKEAVSAAYAECVKQNGWDCSIPPQADFAVLLVIPGWHTGLEV